MNNVIIINHKNAKIAVPTPDNFVSLTKRAEESAKIAKEQADKVQSLVSELKNSVTDVSDIKGELVITQMNGNKKNIKFTKSVNGITPDDSGNIELPNNIMVKFLD